MAGRNKKIKKMSFQLKNLVNEKFLEKVIPFLETEIDNFNSSQFKQKVFDKEWKNRELKQRTHYIAKVLGEFLDKDYSRACIQLVNISKKIQEIDFTGEDLGLMFLPDYIQDFGSEDLQNSIYAIEEVTKVFSCEFAVRPLYQNFPEEMMTQTMKWTKHENHKVRRLASEGCRSKLPWAMAVPYLSENPQKVMKILEILAFDKSDWVRLSVSNNLNDISKDYPDIVLDFAKKNIGKSKEMDKLLKHALRTMLKKGNPKALELFGYKYSKKIQLKDFKFVDKKVKTGSNLEFSFSIENDSKKPEQVRLEYVVYYQKAKGSLAPKVYQIKEFEIKPSEIIKFERKRSFKEITTRKFHKGLHKIAIIINGKEFDALEFELI